MWRLAVAAPGAVPQAVRSAAGRRSTVAGVTAAAASAGLLPPRLPCHSGAALSQRRCFSSDDDDAEVPKSLVRYPKRYFDFKAFRQGLKNKKDALQNAELREVRREYAPPPPEGWTVLEFLKRMDFGEGDEDVANQFETWADFISMSAQDCKRIEDISLAQRKRLARHIQLFNHGLWPPVSTDEFFERFQGKPLENEGKPWTAEDDEELLEQAKKWDVNFGDPWIYISWEMQRREVDVQQRYNEIVVKPVEHASRCELAITKASRPLLMNRKFRMVPPDLYIVPSKENFPVAESEFELPAEFKKYRQHDIF